MRSYLSRKYETESSSSNLDGKYSTYKYLAIVCTVLLVLLGTIFYSNQSTAEIKYTASSTLSTVSPQNSFTFRRIGYEPLSFFESDMKDKIKYSFLSKYIGVIEPYADMEFRLLDADEKHLFNFKVCSTSGICQSGVRYYNLSTQSSVSSTLNVACKPFDKFDVEVKEIDPTSQIELSSVTVKAICIYVRREIRSLTAADLTSFLDASHKLWVTSESEGEQLYGNKFRPVSFLLKYHHYNAGQRRTDSIHNGNGVVLQHVKFTNMFETSLQSVDPSVSLPYWDYTVDSERGSKSDNDMLTADFFGSANFPRDISRGYQSDEDITLGSIRDGRWSLLKTPTVQEVSAEEGGGNPYGYLRAPWNLNPSPFVSRFPFDFGSTKDRLPTCLSHYTSLKSEELMQFFFDSEMEPHGGNHLVIGGVYGCDHFDQMIASGHLTDQSSADMVCLFWVSAVAKSLYRQNLLSPPPSCSDPSTCSYECDLSRESEIYSTIHHYITKHLGLTDVTSSSVVGGISKEEDQQGWVSFLCGGGGGSQVFIGDNYESSSPKDPTFWVIHPTIERLLQAKFLAGGFQSEEWYSDPVNQRVCDYSRCLDVASNSLKYADDCCYGHYENDRMWDVSGSGYFGPSNREVLLALDPRYDSYTVPYIYDGFSWDHCSEDFDGLLTSLKDSHK